MPVKMPKVGNIYVRYDGLTFAVILVANVGSTNPNYPPTIVFQNSEGGPVWALTAEAWDEAFTLHVKTH